MGRLRKDEMEAYETLAQAVINDAPDVAARMLRCCGTGVFTAHILGIAGRFRGLDMVKTLVENGASFQLGLRELDAVNSLFPKIFENEFSTYLPDYFTLFLIRDIDRTREYVLKEYLDQLTDREGNPLKMVCEEELIRVVEYLCDNAREACFYPGDYLYLTILTDDRDMAAALKRKGITLSGQKVRMLTQGGGGSAGTLTQAGGGNEWFAYCRLVEGIKDEDFVRIMSTLIDAVNAAQVPGESRNVSENNKLYFTDWFCQGNSKRFSSPEFMAFFLDHFNQSKMNKTRMMREMIADENIDCLAVAADHGWLRLPHKRDEMIAYATQNGRTESAAWLLDFKNRTADLVAEQEKAEKKLMRELGASPDSAAVLKKLWSSKKQEDGTLIIRNYKGDATQVTIPAKIGKSAVTAVAIGALAGNAVCVGGFYSVGSAEHVERHRRITKLVLPDTIRQIGSYAFSCMWALEEINIPEKVEELAEYTFWDCRSLKSITIPGTVRKVGSCAFFGCSNLEKVIICEGVLEIGARAFESCHNLKEISVPQSVQRLSDDQNAGLLNVFPRNQYLTIHCTRGSSTEEYCRENHFRFVLDS